MGLTSLQVCMDSPDWLQGNIHDDGMDSSSPSGDMLTACSRPAGLMERRLRPPQDHALKCPRCDSTHTKFCYYNNYSLSQPRYFCKTCRRYWTKGGTLRNIPVGGGCRKNKKVTSKKSSDNNHHNQIIAATSNVTGSSSSYYNNINQTDLHLSFPEMQLSHLGNLNLNFLGGSSATNNASFDFMESKLEAIVGASRNYDHFNGDLGMVGPSGLGDMGHLAGPNYGHNGFSYGLPTMDHHGNGSAFTDTCQRLMLPYDQVNANENQNAAVDVKPNPKLLTLDWHDHSNEAGKSSSFGYMNNNNHLQGSWNGGGMMNGY